MERFFLLLAWREQGRFPLEAFVPVIVQQVKWLDPIFESIIEAITSTTTCLFLRTKTSIAIQER